MISVYRWKIRSQSGSLDPAKTSERAFMETELFSYIKNFTATSILEGIDDAAWEATEQLDGTCNLATVVSGFPGSEILN